MTKLSLPICLALFTVATTGFSAPSSGPDGQSAGGSFATYFSNIADNPCTGFNLVTGFSSAPDANYLKTTCTSIGGLLGSFFASFPAASADQALVGFNPTTGAPIYNTISTAWKTVTGGIAYTGGKVGIGTSTPAATLDVSGSLFATNFYDTTNGTWFPWTNGYNYIRGDTYFSGFIVDEQNADFYIDLDSSTVLNDVAISGSITGPAPTQGSHLATKAYVDATVAAAGGGGGGATSIYASDGVTKIGTFLSIAWTDPANQTVCDALYYADNNNVLKTLGAVNCANTWWSGMPAYYPNTNCEGSVVYYIPYSNVTSDVTKNNQGTALGITRTTPIIHMAGTFEYSFWDRATDTCKRQDVVASETWYYANAAIGYGTVRECGVGNCIFK